MKDYSFLLLKSNLREFPRGLVVRILGFHCHGPSSIPGLRTQILHSPQSPSAHIFKGHTQYILYIILKSSKLSLFFIILYPTLKLIDAQQVFIFKTVVCLCLIFPI